MYEDLIKVLRCEYYGDDECDRFDCPILSSLGCRNGIANRAAADALEAADERIAELEAQAETLKEESEAYKFGYLDGKTESDRQIEDLQTALTACRLRKDEAQMPKEGEWIEYPDCLRYEGAYNDTFIACNQCGHVWSTLDNCTETFNYCPNCGAKMKGANDEA